ncbi:FAD-dependent oxidoreductase [Ammonifex degensii]|uniref:FAD-dependent oxidoreductase n=1 Tax=Ammonifex degensii TaxID=42838 RepID=UPI0002EA63FA|nr:FAD-dependent oxidoreductase [Ammonifex degensii]
MGAKEVLVIGGGIAGVQAALDLADQGFKVYLVEKEPSIGGRMIQLQKVFPTMDCPSCIFTPKMASVSNHPQIELMTYTEVEEIKREGKLFRVTLSCNSLQKAPLCR